MQLQVVSVWGYQHKKVTIAWYRISVGSDDDEDAHEYEDVDDGDDHTKDDGNKRKNN